MSNKKKTISEVFSKQFKSVENSKNVKGKVPLDMLAIIRFKGGKYHVICPKDKILCLGLLEAMKEIMEDTLKEL